MYNIENQTDSQKERLKKIINYLKINQTGFAKTVNIPQSYMSEMLNGKKGIANKTLLKIANSYDSISINWLLTGEGEMLLKNGDKKQTKYIGHKNADATENISDYIKQLELRIADLHSSNDKLIQAIAEREVIIQSLKKEKATT